MGIELVILFVLLLLGGFIWLGYFAWKKRSGKDRSSKK